MCSSMLLRGLRPPMPPIRLPPSGVSRFQARLPTTRWMSQILSSPNSSSSSASGERPENTLPAYELAVAQRADMIEIDLHRTADGAVVVTHDETLAGLGGEGEIADASLADVRALDAGGGERVPLLDEVLDAFGPRIPLNLELKQSGRGPYPGLEAIALEAVADGPICLR